MIRVAHRVAQNYVLYVGPDQPTANVQLCVKLTALMPKKNGVVPAG